MVAAGLGRGFRLVPGSVIRKVSDYALIVSVQTSGLWSLTPERLLPEPRRYRVVQD